MTLADYPDLLAYRRFEWAPIDVRFELARTAPDTRTIASVNLIPFVGDDVVLVGIEYAGAIEWTSPGGTLEPGETWREALDRELLEEAGALAKTVEPFGVWMCHSHNPPWRPHLPHPDFVRLFCFGDVEVVSEPTNPPGGEAIACVDVVPLDEAVRRLLRTGQPWHADLYRLAADLRG